MGPVGLQRFSPHQGGRTAAHHLGHGERGGAVGRHPVHDRPVSGQYGQDSGEPGVSGRGGVSVSASRQVPF